MSTVSPVDQDDFSRGGRPKRVGLLLYVCSPPSGVVSRTEDASGAAGGCPQSVESAVLWPLKMRRVPQEPVFGTEYLFRTVEACFLHRMPLKMRRVPQEAFLSTARIFRTIGGPFWYRVLSHMRQVAAAAEPGVHFSRPLLCYRPRCSVDKPFTGTCGGGFM